jgi:hypothetical protein
VFSVPIRLWTDKKRKERKWYSQQQRQRRVSVAFFHCCCCPYLVHLTTDIFSLLRRGQRIYPRSRWPRPQF